MSVRLYTMRHQWNSWTPAHPMVCCETQSWRTRTMECVTRLLRPGMAMLPRTADRRLVGLRGEDVALRYLQRSGFTVLGRDVRLDRDQIDILAFDPQEQSLVFVEVKARSVASSDFRPELGLDMRKRHAMVRAARRWVMDRGYEGGYRMDLVCVVEGQVVDHLKDLAWEG